MSGDDGDDILDGYRGRDTLDGGAGNDILSAGDGNDVLNGGTGNDILDGGAGNDRINSGSGNDIATGSGGNDTFEIEASSGTLTITDFSPIGEGTDPSAAALEELDVLKFSGEGLTAENMVLTQVGDNLEVTFIGVSNTRVILQGASLEDIDNLPNSSGGKVSGPGNILFDGQSEIHDDFDVQDSDDESDSLFHRNTVTFLNDLDNDIKGFNRSDDVINGQGGNDTLKGRSGNDTLRGGDGDDTLIGGKGSDTLVGGTGADLFLLDTPNNGVDIIRDFNSVEGDRLLISQKAFGVDLLLGELSAESFTLGTAASREGDRLIYNSSTGALYYDADGTGAIEQAQIAQFSTQSTLSQSDMLVVA